MSAFSVNRRRILSLRLPRLPTDRIKRQLRRSGAAPADTKVAAEAASEPWVVVGKQHNALQITALNDAAVSLGLEVGLPLASARAICPDVRVFDADDAADGQALNAIADWCDRFTPLVALDPPRWAVPRCRRLRASVRRRSGDDAQPLRSARSSGLCGQRRDRCQRRVRVPWHSRPRPAWCRKATKRWPFEACRYLLSAPTMR